MRILLVAYDFPPIPSPQALRWTYLARELSRQGHDIHVLTADLPGYGPGGLPEVPKAVVVHRVYPGLLSAGYRLRTRRVCAGEPGWRDGQSKGGPPTAGRVLAFEELNWKGRFVHRAKKVIPGSLRGGFVGFARKVASRWLFPDYRAEWAFWARRKFRAMLRDFAPDVVITSHEPAFVLPFGLEARQRGVRWFADLGDPVLAGYTPEYWRDKAAALEGQVCRHADRITVTTRKTIDELVSRHGADENRFLLLTQGFDANFMPGNGSQDVFGFDPGTLELLYTGSFYAFRRIDALLQAVIETPGIRLTIATISPPPEVVRASTEHPRSVRLTGFLRHDEVLGLQRSCDVLVNIANDDPVQVPGKIYEYLGAGTRILHLARKLDAASELLETSGVGVSEANDASALACRLASWRDEKRAAGRRLACAPVSTFDIGPFSWQSLAQVLERTLKDVVAA